MELNEIVTELNLKILTEKKQDFSSISVKSGYCSDLLSCVMTGAETDGIWVTLMAHNNIVAVAGLLDLAAIIITEGAQPDPNTIRTANEKDVILLSTSETNFSIVGKLWDLGLRAN